jgi:hypothetical protein
MVNDARGWAAMSPEAASRSLLCFAVRRHQGSMTNDLFREEAHDPLHADRRNSEEDE